MPPHQRRYPREEVTLRVDYVDAQGRAGLGVATNLSYTGIGLTLLSRPVQVGETLLLTFVTATGNACKLRARVVHTPPRGAGLEFTQAPEAYRQLRGAIAAAFLDMPEGRGPI